MVLPLPFAFEILEHIDSRENLTSKALASFRAIEPLGKRVGARNSPASPD